MKLTNSGLQRSFGEILVGTRRRCVSVAQIWNGRRVASTQHASVIAQLQAMNSEMGDNETNAGLDVERQIQSMIDAALDRYRRPLKWFLCGLCAFIASMVGVGLVDGGDLLRTLHDKAFPAGESDFVAISYESTIELRGGENSPNQVGYLSFYARNGQRVRIFANFNHRFHYGQPLRRIVASVDGKPLGEPTDTFVGGFKDITGHIQTGVSFEREERVHSVGFSLDDTQPKDLTDEVSIVCIVLVYGNTD